MNKLLRKTGQGTLCLMLILTLLLGAFTGAVPISAAAERVDPATETSGETEPGETLNGEWEEEAPGALWYANGVTGFLWIDRNGDGAYGSDEEPLAKYPVYLCEAEDVERPVYAVKTDAHGRYEFANIEPGMYVVVVRAGEDRMEFLLPTIGVKRDNRFTIYEDLYKPHMEPVACSDPMWIGEDTVYEGINAGMRVPAETDEDSEANVETEESETAETPEPDREPTTTEVTEDGEPEAGEQPELPTMEETEDEQETATESEEEKAAEEIDLFVPKTPEMGVSKSGEGAVIGMSPPMGIQSTSIQDDIWEQKVNFPIDIDGMTWYVVKKLPNYNSSGINYVLLIRRMGVQPMQFNPTGNNKVDYSESALRTHMIDQYITNQWIPTIKQLAVVPNLSLGQPFSTSVYSWPTTTPAEPNNSNKDIFFPLSYADIYELNGYGTGLKNGSLFFQLPTRVWARTAVNTSGGSLYGVYHANGNGSLDYGLSPAATYVSANPAVWVKAGEVNVNVKVHYVDTEGVDINPSITDQVVYGGTFSVSPVPTFTGYTYFQWKREANGTANDASVPVTITNVTSYTNIYLVYKKNYVVTEKHVDVYGNSVAPDRTVVAYDDRYSSNAPSLTGYTYKGYIWDSAPAPGNTTNLTPGNVSNEPISGDRTIFFVYEVSYTVTEIYITTDGTSIAQNTYALLASGETYTKTPPHIPGYEYKGYKWSVNPPSDASDFTLGYPSEVITENRTIYFVYKALKQGFVSITKMVAGATPDMSKTFEFQLYFLDADGKPLQGSDNQVILWGDIVEDSGATAPNDGVPRGLYLDHDGKVNVSLKHGQKYIILGLYNYIFQKYPGYMLRIVETDSGDYSPSFTDADTMGTGGEHDTGYRLVDDGYERTFAFVNTPPTTLTISKVVDGSYADKTKRFAFSVYFMDSNGEPLPADTVVTATGDDGGPHTLDGDGKATFHLAHGQSVAIEDIAPDVMISILEEKDDNYATTFVDSGGEVEHGVGTGNRPMTQDRTFTFTNVRHEVIPTGADAGETEDTLPLIVLGILAGLAFLAMVIVHRRWRAAPRYYRQ